MTQRFSNSVMTVLGPVNADALGPTLMHEHILNDCTCWWRGRDLAFTSPVRDVLVSPDVLWQLRNDPFANKHWRSRNWAFSRQRAAAQSSTRPVRASGVTRKP